jgi:hypothetical protein
MDFGGLRAGLRGALVGKSDGSRAQMTFDSVRTVGFLDRLAADRVAFVAGCEAHVCVLQAVLSLMTAGAKAPTDCKQLRNA